MRPSQIFHSAYVFYRHVQGTFLAADSSSAETLMQQVLGEVSNLAKRIGERFDPVDARLDRVETRLDNVELRMTRLEAETIGLRSDFADLRKRRR